jgi:hypothetical protein
MIQWERNCKTGDYAGYIPGIPNTVLLIEQDGIPGQRIVSVQTGTRPNMRTQEIARTDATIREIQETLEGGLT